MYYIIGLEDEIENYASQLKERYYQYKISESNWPPISTKFTKLGYVIHKPKRTAKETQEFSKSAITGHENLSSAEHACDDFGLGEDQYDNDCFDVNVTIKEDISDIILPVTNDNRSQIILIEGAPGIGKTMLMVEIASLWAKGEILQDKKIMLFLTLREHKINEIKSCKDMFNYSCGNEQNAAMYEKYFSINNGRSLVILLDGLDENLQAIEKGTFLYEAFIKANRFSHACLIITSRPHATANLQKHVSYRVEIVGFTDIKRRQYVQENLKGKHKDLEEYLQNHPTIDTLCYIPLNMSILLFLFHEKNRLNNHLPDTQTELTKQAVSMTILHNLEKLGVKGLEPHIEKLPATYYKLFICLCKLAYKELSKNKYIFTNEDIKELDYFKSKVSYKKLSPMD